MTLLEIKNLTITFKTSNDSLIAVDNVSFHVDKGETVGIVGETGSGKTITSLSIMRLLPSNAKVSGEIFFNGKDLLKISEKEMDEIRGKKISMIFQEPMTAFDPLYTIGDQFSEVLFKHENVSKLEAKKRSIEMLKLVGIPEPEKRFYQYPHEYSGGMIQRAMIALALLTNPELVIADEPTTGLDVTIQMQVLNLIKRIQRSSNLSMIFITHDLGVISKMANRIIVLYLGKIFEVGSVKDVIFSSVHPYTKGLIASVPTLKTSKSQKLYSIPGNVPSLKEIKSGCRFYSRCPVRMDICKDNDPKLFEYTPGHFVSCWAVDPNRNLVNTYE
ncbi:ABC transporter ATP-binding protein [Athalassotoga saccharophila]|uniref:ABC transporter ATP-binding protein n=1 Tax=Athalassotoga saccharophila TaxID=1441386 RepID=UPI001379F546|nr:ABC transporter ATP-binding protein [Athalassotoga saccharophila]BBJ28791.1 oligopeptide transport ATP-binding protein OppD [Athalassotoga saccharophila]